MAYSCSILESSSAILLRVMLWRPDKNIGSDLSPLGILSDEAKKEEFVVFTMPFMSFDMYYCFGEELAE